MDNRPIGVFDSGVGGLTTVRALRELLPNEDIVYFGDTGRLPYGTRLEGEIIQFAQQDIDFLMYHNVKYILAACGTVSSVYPQRLSARLSVPYLGVVAAAARSASEKTRNKKVCVLGTQATIQSGSFAKALTEIDKEIQVLAIACPLFVTLVEQGQIGYDCEPTRLAAQKYLEDCIKFGADTVILGCTHYPLLSDTISTVLQNKAVLINPGREQALAAKDFMQENDMLSDKTDGATCKYFASANAQGFKKLSKMFLKEYASDECELASVEKNYGNTKR